MSDQARDLALWLRYGCRQPDPCFKTLALSTLSLRTINARLLQHDKEGEAADFKSEISHNTIMLKAGIGLGIINGARMRRPSSNAA